MAQGEVRDPFQNYHREKSNPAPTNQLEPHFAEEMYARQNNLEVGLQKDLSVFLGEYLIQTPMPAKAEILAQVDADPFLKQNFTLYASQSLLNSSLQILSAALPKDALVKAIVQVRKSNQLVPIHFEIYDSSPSTEKLSTYYERGTHKVKMALDQVDPRNWFTWFAHEHLHFLDPILRNAEMKSGEIGLTNAVAILVQKQNRTLTSTDTQNLNTYFSLLTDLSIKAEWRDWIATSLFAQKMMHAGLLKEVPPCLSYLVKFGFGERDLTTDELKDIWWNKLKIGFYVEPTGLFTDPWLKTQLLNYVQSLDPTTLPIEHLLELTE